MFKTIEWTKNGVRMLDQTRLPAEEVYRTYSDYLGVAEAIRTMVIRGAPAIGVAAAMGVALGVQNSRATTPGELSSELDQIAATLSKTRPTAINLFWAIRRMRAAFEEVLARDGTSPSAITTAKERLVSEAQKILAEDVAVNQAIGQHGAALLQNTRTVLTHCNAGALATGGYGTALGVIRAAVAAGNPLHVFADETRPFLQGARLTAWELAQDHIPVTLITDNMAGHFMQRRQIQAVIVGADRIAANGDVANKIGTYALAVLAKENQVPFYVAAPTSTIDLSVASGDQIPIEERSAEEVKQIAGVRIAPPAVEACNPAFDVTPHRYVGAIVTERGVVREPYCETLKALFQ